MIAVAGSTGYIGGLLCERLRAEGADVVALARRPEAAASLRAAGCEVRRADVLDPTTLDEALDGVTVAYYLVHSMGRGSSGDFAARDVEGARNFALAAGRRGVERIVYLGGLGEGSEHLDSRHATAEALRAGEVPVAYLRAAAVIGAGSESFRTVFYLVRRLPVMVTPRWVVTRTQPVAVADAIGCLAAAGRPDVDAAREVQIGGPDVTTYGGMIDELALAMGRRAPLRLTVPLLTPWLSSLWIGLVTPVDAGVARPLIEGLATETVVDDPSGMRALGEVPSTPLRAALATALAQMRSSSS